jgi:tRNA A-37 threonylcarbamoyl transferase component Bud32/WD40 repeat protein
MGNDSSGGPGNREVETGEDAGADGAFDSFLEKIAHAPRQSPEESDSSGGSNGAESPGRDTVLEETYEIIEPLTEAGGMGQVYLARDLHLGRRVVVKMIRTRRLDEEHRRLFEREARATARLKHPHVVTIHAFGFWEGCPYMVLELLRGQSLRERLDAGPISERRAIDLILEVVRGLGHAHRHGILHRDIKPDNIFVTDTGTAKLLDFGISRVDRDEENSEDGQHAALGTPGFMAPEQWRAREQDERTDLWGVGATLYTMLAGRPPYDPNRPATLFVDGIEPIRDYVSDIRASTEAFVECALSIEAGKRHADTEVMLEHLEAIRAELRETDELTGPPFRYLEAFGEQQADWFFGRDNETARLASRVEASAITALVGPSGAGKSSLLRAGLIPRLRQRQNAEILIVEPGDRPLRELQHALAPLVDDAEERFREPNYQPLRERPGLAGQILRGRVRSEDRPVVLVVEHLEQLVARGISEQRREAFAAALRSASDDMRSGVRVVCSLREDFLARLTPMPTLQDRLTRNMMVLGAPTTEALREALTGPLELAGYTWPEELVDRVVEEVASAPTPLPTLQIVMSRVWEMRDRSEKSFPSDALEQLGGISGALSAHADGVVDRLPDGESRRIARDMFCAVVTADGTARAAEREELLERFWDVDRAAAVLEQLVEGRLLRVSSSADEETVELAHEALVTRWGRLTRWRRDEAASKPLRERLTDAARHWEREGRPDALVWRGEMVERASEWQEGQAEQLTVSELEFLDVSREVSRREGWRRWTMFAAAVVLAVVAIIAVRELWPGEAEEKAREKATRMASLSGQVLATEPDLAVTLAGRAVRRNRSRETVSALHRALREDHLVGRRTVDAGVHDALATSKGESVLVFPNTGWSVTVWHPGSGQVDTVGLEGDIQPAVRVDGVGRLLFRSDSASRGIRCSQGSSVTRSVFGNLVAADGACHFPVLADDGRLGLVGAEPGSRDIRWLTAADGWTRRRIDLSPTGDRVLVVSRPTGSDAEFVVETLAYETGKTVQSFGSDTNIVDARFAGDGETIWSLEAGADDETGSVLKLRATDGAVRAEAHLPVTSTARLETADSGRRLAVGTPNGEGRVFRRSGETIRAIGQFRQSDDFKFGPAGKQLALFYDSEVRLRPVSAFDAGEGTKLAHRSSVSGLSFVPGADRFVTWSGNRGVLWDAEGRRLDTFLTSSSIRGLQPAPGGRRILAVTEVGVEVHQLWGQLEGMVTRHDGSVTDLEIGGQGSLLGSVSRNGDVRLHRLGEKDIASFQVERPHPRIAFRPGNSDFVVTGGKAVEFRDGDGEKRAEFVAEDPIDRAGWLPGGEMAWIATSQPGLGLVSPEEGLMEQFPVDSPVTAVEWSRDGHRVLVVGDGVAELRERDGTQVDRWTFDGRLADAAVAANTVRLAIVDAEGRLQFPGTSEWVPGHLRDSGTVEDAVFAPASTDVATLDASGRVTVWSGDEERSREFGRLRGARSIAYSPGGTYLLASSDSVTAVWRVKDGEPVAQLPAGASELEPRHITTDGTYAAFAGGRGGVEAYSLPVDKLLRVARRQASRPLTVEEMRRFGLGTRDASRTAARR